MAPGTLMVAAGQVHMVSAAAEIPSVGSGQVVPAAAEIPSVGSGQVVSAPAAGIPSVG